MKEVIVKVLDQEEMQSEFTKDGNVFKATMPSPYQNMGELIRCKDCKYNVLADRPYFEDSVSVETYQHCYYLSGMTKQMGYCALAERKEE
jgi:hypothetical protein